MDERCAISLCDAGVPRSVGPYFVSTSGSSKELGDMNESSESERSAVDFGRASIVVEAIQAPSSAEWTDSPLPQPSATATNEQNKPETYPLVLRHEIYLPLSCSFKDDTARPAPECGGKMWHRRLLRRRLSLGRLTGPSNEMWPLRLLCAHETTGARTRRAPGA